MRVGRVGQFAQAPPAVDGLAGAVGQVNERGEPAVGQQHAVGQRDLGRGVDELAVGVERLRRRQRGGTVHADEYLRRIRAEDPLLRTANRLKEAGTVDDDGLAQIDAEVEREVEAAVEFADESPEPDPKELYTNIYANPITPGEAAE